MSEKISIVYVGKKTKKKDTITGSRLIFKRGEPMPVDLHIARRLLEYPKVWVEESEAKSVIEKSEEAEKLAKEQAEKLAKEQAISELEQSCLVNDSDGNPLDLTKYNGGQLQTLVEAEDLTIDAKAKPVADYRFAIRDAMRKKYGTPELEQ